jgi:diguanylate cyclase (GGDEF)-like protein
MTFFPPAAPPVSIPRVDLGDVLGRGSHSIVYRGRHGEQDVAVKVALRARSDGADNARFLREAALLATLRHPGFPEIYDVGESDGHAFLVMELVEGTTLAERLKRGRLAPPTVLRLARQLASALAAVHRRGLVHRDVKPQNIVVDDAGRARLIDFGLVARAAHSAELDIGGTFLYSAPEQTGMLKRPIDGRADLYGLGVVLYEALAGQPPFVAEDPGELIRQHAVSQPTPLAQVAEDVDPALASMVGRLLAKDPDDRYQTAAGLASDLGRIEQLREERSRELLLGRDDFLFGVLREAPLVGRERELALMKDRWRSARRGQGSFLVIEGEAGCGKTRLARELLGFVREAGGVVLSASASQGTRAPFSAFHEAVDSLFAHFNRLPESDRVRFREAARAIAGDAAPILRRFSPRLGVLLGAERDGDHGLGASDQFFEAVASFFVGLAEHCGGVVLSLDDITWLDDASLRVTERIAARTQDVPLLVVATARTSEEDGRNRARVASLVRSATTITLPMLEEPGLRRFASAYLGSDDVPAELVDALVARSRGSPLLASGYLRAMLEHGLLLPRWGSWFIDTSGLDSLELGGDIVDLMGARVDALGERARRVLEAATVIGPRFELGLLQQVADAGPDEVSAALGDALASCLVEQVEGGSYAFVHERIRAALFERLALDEERALHQTIADSLYAEGGFDGDAVYAIATHYAQGYTDRDPRRVFETSHAAGRHALEQYAYEEAYHFLSRAEEFAGKSGEPCPGELLEGLGQACARSGRLERAKSYLERLLASTEDRLHRARVRAALAQVHVWDSFRTVEAWQQTEAIFRELGHPLPKTRVGRVVTSLWYFLCGLIIDRTGVGYGKAVGAGRERMRILTQTLKSAGHVAYWNMQPVFTVLLVLRSLFFAHRLGRSAELVQTYVGSSLVFAAVGRPGVSRRFGDRAVEIAESLGDKALAAYGRMNRGIARNARGESLASEREMKSVLTEREAWLDVGEYTQGCTDLSWNLQLRGYPREALKWVERGLERERQASPQRGQIFLPTKASACLASLGETERAGELLEDARRIADAAPEDRYRQANYLSHLVFFYLEAREVKKAMQAVEAYRRLGIAPKLTPFHFRNFFVYQAYVWLMRSEEEGFDAEAEAGLARAVEELRVTAYTGHPAFVGHLLVLEGALHRLRRADEKAFAALEAAARSAEAHDNAWVTFEVKRQRALLLRQRGEARAGARLAEEAFSLSLDIESPLKARLIRRDFDLGRSTTRTASQAIQRDPPGEHADGARAVHLERYVEALIRVSQVSLSVLDGAQQARAILDEVVSLFGAERAFLFFEDNENRELRLFAARNAAGADLEDARGYAARVVEDVHSHQRARVVSGNEDAASIGSESAIAYDLRSIVAAPLRVRDRPIGVVYLDNRLAKGVFTSDDVEILTAICNHIAVAIETAKAAKLELQYKTERDKRALAEALRTLIGPATPQTREEDVLGRLLTQVEKLVPAAKARYFRRKRSDGRRRGNGDGAGAPAWQEVRTGRPARAHEVLDVMAEDRRARLLPAESNAFESAPVADAKVVCWLGAPLVVGDEVAGVLALETRDAEALDRSHLELAQTFADQASIALDNARLFARVEQLATHDELTGLVNRRALLDKAWGELRRAIRYEQPLSAMLIDVDHFKRINDQHGHPVGDEVLRVLAARFRDSVRDVDLVSRYGGEEFIVLMPQTTGREAASSLAERLRKRVSREPVPTMAGPLTVTVSVGVAEGRSADAEPQELFARADVALYQAKREGRDRVVLAEGRDHDRDEPRVR